MKENSVQPFRFGVLTLLLAMLLRDLHPTTLAICIAYDLVLAAGICGYAYRIIGDIVLRRKWNNHLRNDDYSDQN